MSAINSSSSNPNLTGAAYATNLAQSSAIRRSLANLGTAIQKGELVPADNLLKAFIKANPQLLKTQTSNSQSQNSLNQAFDALQTALSNHQIGGAQTAWAQIQTNLASQGVNLENPASSTTEAVAQAETSKNSQVLSHLFGTTPGEATSAATLIGGSTETETSSGGVSSALLGAWVTYHEGGTTAPAASAAPASSLLNTAA